MIENVDPPVGEGNVSLETGTRCGSRVNVNLQDAIACRISVCP